MTIFPDGAFIVAAPISGFYIAYLPRNNVIRDEDGGIKYFYSYEEAVEHINLLWVPSL